MEWAKNSQEGKGKDYFTVFDIFIYTGIGSHKTRFMVQACKLSDKVESFIRSNFRLETASDYGGVKQLKLDWWTSALQARGVKHIAAKNHP